MRRFAGCCRFLWNKALALEKETYEADKKTSRLLCPCWKVEGLEKRGGYLFLAEAHSQILQQTLKDLDRAYKNFLRSVRIFRVSRRRGSMMLFAIRRVSGWTRETVAYFFLK